MKKSPIYTRTGDTGTTALVGGARVDKDDIRLEAYGTVDELNSLIGLLASVADPDPDTAALLTQIQSRMFDIGAYLATVPSPAESPLAPGTIEAIEAQIDRLDTLVPPLRTFILPAGCTPATVAHTARTVCRRCERRIVTLGHQADIHPDILRYINRLSDMLFVYARYLNISAEIPEVAWAKQ